jgi:geranylgeranyl diphosphate synthase type II
VHRAFGERLAVLAGDALIVLAFQTLAAEAAAAPRRLVPLALVIAKSVGMPFGIAAGQAWESEPEVDLASYHQSKTGALFAAATMAGACAAGVDGAAWRTLGERVGEAYQVADDIRDAFGTEAELGKPVGQDAAHDRPSAARRLGLDGAVDRLRQLAAEAVAMIPPCPGQAELRSLILSESRRLLPASVSLQAA